MSSNYYSSSTECENMFPKVLDLVSYDNIGIGSLASDNYTNSELERMDVI